MKLKVIRQLKDRLYFQLWDNEEPVSYCYLYPNTIGRHLLSVNTPKLKHRQKGYATAMLKTMLRWCVNNDVPMIGAEVSPFYGNNNIYRKAGFYVYSEKECQGNRLFSYHNCVWINPNYRKALVDISWQERSYINLDNFKE